MIDASASPPAAPSPTDGFPFALARVIAVALAIIAVDQWTKHWVSTHLRQLGSFSPGYDRIVIIPGFFDIVHHRNFGAAFGILQGHRTFFLVATVVAMILLFYMFHTAWRSGERRCSRHVVWPLFFGGAVGNLIDRIRGDGVVDFLHFYHEPLGHYPSFNVADSCICIGICLLIFYSLPRRRRTGAGADASLHS
ncbi:signal peptidase II [bacterium]|nr:signal peptidase II [bacterium]